MFNPPRELMDQTTKADALGGRILLFRTCGNNNDNNFFFLKYSQTINLKRLIPQQPKHFRPFAAKKLIIYQHIFRLICFQHIFFCIIMSFLSSSYHTQHIFLIIPLHYYYLLFPRFFLLIHDDCFLGNCA